MSTTAAEQLTGDLRYPVGDFDWTAAVARDSRGDSIATLADGPARLREAVAGLTDAQLDTPYRPGGWTVRQVVHHVADSHMNSYVRFRLALTEDNPTVKPYDEARWADLPDAKGPLVETSLCLIDCLHKRWVSLLHTLTDEQWNRTFQHPQWGNVSLEKNLALYAWHSRHHVAHITGLRRRNGW